MLLVLPVNSQKLSLNSEKNPSKTRNAIPPNSIILPPYFGKDNLTANWVLKMAQVHDCPSLLNSDLTITNWNQVLRL